MPIAKWETLIENAINWLVLGPPLNNDNLLWIQWWFWTIVGLGIIVAVLASTAVHYRRKVSKVKETLEVDPHNAYSVR